VLIGGNAIVSGDTFRPVTVVGSLRMAGAAVNEPHLEWANRPGATAALDGGEIAGALSMLAPANGGKGGAIAEAANEYNLFAAKLAADVNAVHRQGETADSTTGAASGLDFFAIDPALPVAIGLSVVPSDVSGIATGTPGAGAYNGGNADAIAKIGTAIDSPDKTWSSFVTRTGVSARTEMQQAVLGELAATSASSNQLANASVDLDEENVNMLTFQVAYQGAARVMTAIDEMLDTLINRTGIVGR